MPSLQVAVSIGYGLIGTFVKIGIIRIACLISLDFHAMDLIGVDRFDVATTGLAKASSEL